jgi:hypothetical protein
MSFNANTLYKAVDIDKLAKECRDAIKGRTTKRPFFIVPVHSQSSQGLTNANDI